MDTLVGVLRGLGYSIVPMLVSLLGACGLRIFWIMTIFQIPMFHTLDIIYLSYPVTWLVTAATHFICYVIIMRRLKDKIRLSKEASFSVDKQS